MMKNNIKTYSLLAVSMAMTTAIAGCSDGDEPVGVASQVVSISISDAGFGSNSRATETGYATEFAAGDACGLYIMRGGRIISENIRIQASAGEGGQIIWTSDSPIYGGFEGESLFLYYPYQDNMNGKVDVTATDDATFFSPLISGWEVKTDQSDYADYTASDLMTAIGNATATADGKTNISFSMTHRMALAVIPAPMTIYKYLESRYCYGPMPDFSYELPIEFLGNAIPYHFEDTSDDADRTAYRYLHRPGQRATISGKFETFMEYGSRATKKLRAFSMTTSGKQGGTYISYNLDPDRGPIECNLRIGDYFCKDKNNDWYLRPEQEGPGDECIGIVFYAGFNWGAYSAGGPYPPDADMRDDYNTPLYEDGPSLPEGVFHGYVVALTDVTDVTNKYGRSMKKSLPWCTSTSNFWYKNLLTIGNKFLYRGYYNNLQIQKFIKETEGITKYDFPAATACEYYGKRDFEWNNFSGRDPMIYSYDNFGWQTRFLAPDNTTGWFIPSIGQLLSAVQILSLNKDVIESINGVPLQSKMKYWTCVESRTEDLARDASDAHYLPYNGYSPSYTPPAVSKTSSNDITVRPILVF